MDEYINESAETQEVAEPETDVEESAEMQEAADPAEAKESSEAPEEPSGKTAQDSAFAEQRRRIAELEEHARDIEAQNKAMFDALSRYFDGDSAEELSINANAYAEQRDPDEYRQEYERKREYEQLQQDNEALRDRMLTLEIEKRMREDLRVIQEIDPNVKDLDDLGETYANLIGAGLSATEAYYGAKAHELKEKVLAPNAIGRVGGTATERDYYTSEELDNLTNEEMDANWDKVMRSMSRLPIKR